MIEGSSTDEKVAEQVYRIAHGRERVLVTLDSNHTHEHVLRELELYSPLVKAGSYLIVYDTTIEDQPEGHHLGRPWDKHNNPKTAVWEFLAGNDRFVIDKDIENKLLITVSRDGFLKCVQD
jgi:cephalosporin hydroxylase